MRQRDRRESGLDVVEQPKMVGCQKGGCICVQPEASARFEPNAKAGTPPMPGERRASIGASSALIDCQGAVIPEDKRSFKMLCQEVNRNLAGTIHSVDAL